MEVASLLASDFCLVSMTGVPELLCTVMAREQQEETLNVQTLPHFFLYRGQQHTRITCLTNSIKWLASQLYFSKTLILLCCI